MTIPSQGCRTAETQLSLSPRSGADLVRVGGDLLGLCVSGAAMLKIDLLKTKCACGCGAQIASHDYKGRRRRWAKAHHLQHMSGPDHPRWKGGRSIHPEGYIILSINGEHVLEHRLVVEQELGRLLSEDEVVHHIDEDRTNNDPANLMVLPNHRAHFGIHARMRSATHKQPRQCDEQNSTVICACGCGETRDKYDRKGRLRLFLPGHFRRTDARHRAAIAKAYREGRLP